MTLAITPEQMEIYKRTARARQVREEQARLARLQTAWLVAREAARMLKERFGARRVVAYGSLVHRTRFQPDSDIDLATGGLRHWKADEEVKSHAESRS